MHTVHHGKRIVVTQMDDLQEEAAARGSSSRGTSSRGNRMTVSRLEEQEHHAKARGSSDCAPSATERRYSGGKGKHAESQNAKADIPARAKERDEVQARALPPWTQHMTGLTME